MNYNLIMKEIISKLDKNKNKLLLHSCCAPCSSHVLSVLADVFEITIYYYNPNIYPHEEFKKRVIEQINFINKLNTKYPIHFIEEEYDSTNFYNMARGLEDKEEGGIRCFKCYNMRLEKTCKYAKENNFDYFTTTLSVSPYKNANKLNEIGKKLEEEYNIKYLYSDFKKENGYKHSIELSKKYNLYRQNYCGCEFSYNLMKKRNDISCKV